MATEINIDWYERRGELEPGMVFDSCYGIVKLDRRVPGDATKWYVVNKYSDWRPPEGASIEEYNEGRWFHDGMTVEPSDLITLSPG